MNVLITGTTGYTGSGIADALVAADHRVSGLARSDESARKLEERNIRAVKGDITDAGSLREATRGAEAVVHTVLMHGEGAEEAERTVVGAVLDVLRGTGRTFVYNSRVWVMGDTPADVDLADEETRVDPPPMFAWRPAVEEGVLGPAQEEGVHAFVVRSGIAYGRVAGGTVGELVDTARERGAAAPGLDTLGPIGLRGAREELVLVGPRVLSITAELGRAL